MIVFYLFVLQSILPISHVASVLTSNVHTLSNTDIREVSSSRKTFHRKSTKHKGKESDTVSYLCCLRWVGGGGGGGVTKFQVGGGGAGWSD